MAYRLHPAIEQLKKTTESTRISFSILCEFFLRSLDPEPDSSNGQGSVRFTDAGESRHTNRDFRLLRDVIVSRKLKSPYKNIFGDDGFKNAHAFLLAYWARKMVKHHREMKSHYEGLATYFLGIRPPFEFCPSGHPGSYRENFHRHLLILASALEFRINSVLSGRFEGDGSGQRENANRLKLSEREFSTGDTTIESMTLRELSIAMSSCIESIIKLERPPFSEFVRMGLELEYEQYQASELIPPNWLPNADVEVSELHYCRETKSGKVKNRHFSLYELPEVALWFEVLIDSPDYVTFPSAADRFVGVFGEEYTGNVTRLNRKLKELIAADIIETGQVRGTRLNNSYRPLK